MKNAQFNVNERVTVQLTDHGVDILRHNHYEYQNYLKSKDPQHEVREFVPPENNMYTDQMWHFMKTFGEYMGWGRENPFVLTITIHNIDSQESQQLKAEKEKWEHLFFLLKSDFEKLENYQTYEWRKYAIENGLEIDKKLEES